MLGGRLCWAGVSHFGDEDVILCVDFSGSCRRLYERGNRGELLLGLFDRYAVGRVFYYDEAILLTRPFGPNHPIEDTIDLTLGGGDTKTACILPELEKTDMTVVLSDRPRLDVTGNVQQTTYIRPQDWALPQMKQLVLHLSMLDDLLKGHPHVAR